MWRPSPGRRGQTVRYTLWREKKHMGDGRCSGLLTFESLLVARVYKVFLFKSKWLQMSLAASGPWVTMAAIRFRQVRAILHRDNGKLGISGTAEAQSRLTTKPPHHKATCIPGCGLLSPNQKREWRTHADMLFKKKITAKTSNEAKKPSLRRP